MSRNNFFFYLFSWIISIVSYIKLDTTRVCGMCTKWVVSLRIALRRQIDLDLEWKRNGKSKPHVAYASACVRSGRIHAISRRRHPPSTRTHIHTSHSAHRLNQIAAALMSVRWRSSMKLYAHVDQCIFGNRRRFNEENPKRWPVTREYTVNNEWIEAKTSGTEHTRGRGSHNALGVIYDENCNRQQSNGERCHAQAHTLYTFVFVVSGMRSLACGSAFNAQTNAPRHTNDESNLRQKRCMRDAATICKFPSKNNWICVWGARAHCMPIAEAEAEAIAERTQPQQAYIRRNSTKK